MAQVNQGESLSTLMAECDALIVLAGAGMSADSGVPTYRDRDGFWSDFPQFKAEGMGYREAASERAFKALPQRSWGMYSYMLSCTQRALPHDGYHLLAQWQSAGRPLFVVTSNVDGYFLRAGIAEDAVWEIHGSLLWRQCAYNCSDRVWHDTSAPVFDPSTLEVAHLPSCPNCLDLVRPNIVMFDDGWVQMSRIHEQQRHFSDFLYRHRKGRLGLVEVGAGTVVASIREIGWQIRQQVANSFLVRINPESVDQGDDADAGRWLADYRLEMRALPGLQLLLAGL